VRRLKALLCFAQALVLISPLMTACSRDTRSADTKICTEQAEKKVPTSELLYLRSASSEEEHHDSIGSDIAECMGSKGYRHDSAAMADGRCVDDVDYNPYCYRKAT
jgi:hypothetical protein